MKLHGSMSPVGRKIEVMSAKKKRMGSHRRSNQSKMDTESLHIEGSASAAELIQEEKSEADLLASPDHSQSETQQSLSSEMTGHRRKFGSSRSKKGRGHVKESITESGHKPREELEEDTKDNETLEIKMSIETPEHRDLNDPSEHDGNSSLISLPVPDVMEALISRSENQQEVHNERETDSELVSDFHKLEEPKLESIDVSLTQSGDVTSESAYYDISTFHISPAISKSTSMEVSDVASSVYSLTEKQNRERDDADLVRQDEPFHTNPFVETEAAESPITSGLSTKEKLREQTEIECSMEEEIPKEEIHIDEEQSELINLSQVEGAHKSEDDLTEREAEAAQMQDVQHILVSSVSVRNEAEDPFDTGSVKLTDQLELHGVYRDEDQVEDDVKPTAEQAVHHEMKGLLSEDGRKESTLETLYTEMNAPLTSQHQDMSDKQPDTDFYPVVSRRKLGSSRRNKGKHHVKDSAAESQNQNKEEVPENIDNEPGGITEMPSSDEVVMQEKTVLEGMDTSEDAHHVDIPELINLNVQSGPTVDQQLIDQSKSTEMAQEELHSVDSATDPQFKEKDEETEVSTHDGDLYGSNLESESHVNSEDVEFLQTQDVTAEKPSLSEHIEAVLTEVDTSANASNEVKDTTDLVSIINVESNPTADQQLIETEYSADEEKMPLPLAEDAYLNKKQTNLSEIGGAHQSNTEATKIQDMPQAAVTSERLTHEATDSFNPYSLNLSDTELGQVQKDEDQAEDDLKPATEEAVHHELKEVPSKVEEGDSSLLTKHTEVNVSLPSEHQDIFDSEEKQTHMTSRRKLGSSRRIKQRQHVEDSGESLEEIKEDIRVNKDSLQTEVSDIRDNSPLVGTSEISTSSVQSSPTVDPQLADQTNATEMPHKDLHSFDSAPERSTKREEETGTTKQDGNVEANNLVKEPHVKSEEKESSKAEITVENISFGENTTQESNVNEAFVSLQKEFVTNEQQNRLVSLSGLTVPPNLEDKVSEVDEEIKTTLQNTQPEMHIRMDTQPLENPENIHSEQTQTSIETIEDGGTKKLKEERENHNAEAEESMNVNVPGHVEVGLQLEAPAVKETHALVEFTHTELFPVSHNQTKTVAQLDTFLEENVRAEASMEESSISEAGDESKDQGTPDQSENLQIKPKQKRRKMGSTRRTQMNRKEEEENEAEGGNFHTDIDGRDHEKTKVLEELPVMLMQNEKPLQSETQKEGSPLEEEHKSLSHETPDLIAAVPLQVPPHGEAVVNPVMFANAASVSNSEKNEDVILNISQPVDFTSAETHMPSVVAGSSSISMNQLLPIHTENAGIVSVYEMSQSTQNDDKIPESLSKIECEESIEQKALKSAEVPAVEIVREEGYNNTLDNMREQNILHEGVSNINTEMKNESPDLNLTNRRRKMGSTRRSLGARPKREDLNEKQADSTEDTEMTVHTGEAMTQSIYGIKEKELQLQTEHEDGNSDRGKDKGFETVDYSNTGDTCKTSVPQQLDDENPVSQGSVEDSDQVISDDLPEIPAASSNLDAMSDSVVGGRRRKMGSHRRSRGAQTTKQGEITDTQSGSDVTMVQDESVMKTAEKKLDKITEVNESYTNPFSISTPSTSQTVSEKPSERTSPVQHLYPDVQLGQERQKKISLGYTGGTNFREVMYDVVMIGDSCVGKTSFMKRAQSGKFSLDLPASVGLDSCIWTVIVDGKTVVLHLWDTAGQERFRSLTRQTFHKAQAFLLMYDVSSAESFSAVSYWVNCIKEGAAEDVIVLLLGNKCDHATRQIKTQQGENLAKEYNFDFMECSAATGENVIESLETVARQLSQNAVITEETLVLLKEPKPKNKSGCC